MSINSSYSEIWTQESTLSASLHPSRRGIPEYVGGKGLQPVLSIEASNTTAATSYLQEDLEGQDTCKNAAALASHFGTHSTNDHATESTEMNWVWRIDAPLPNVPQHAPLERTSLLLRDLPLDLITTRISNFLRINSISSLYSTEVSGKVDCQTCNCIKFVVQLWNDEERNAVVVEVQRRRGCSIRMRRLRNCLYNCIISADDPCRNCCKIKIRKLSKVLQKTICDQLNSEQSVENQEQSTRRRFSDGQLLCLSLLESEKADENRLGLESFVGMTDPSNEESSHTVARALILNEGINSSRLRQAFLEFLCAKLPSGDGARDWYGVPALHTRTLMDDATLFEIPDIENTELGEVHVLALTALVNCLESIDTQEQDYLANEATKLQLSTPFWTRVLEVLVYNLYEPSKRPFEAALSAKSLRILENLRPEKVSPIIDSFVAPILKSAHEFGKARHLLLEVESEDLVSRYCTGLCE